MPARSQQYEVDHNASRSQLDGATHEQTAVDRDVERTTKWTLIREFGIFSPFVTK